MSRFCASLISPYIYYLSITTPNSSALPPSLPPYPYVSPQVTRYDGLLAQLDASSLKTQSTLSLLNFGQNAIFTAGLTTVMWMAANGIVAGELAVELLLFFCHRYRVRRVPSSGDGGNYFVWVNFGFQSRAIPLFLSGYFLIYYIIPSCHQHLFRSITLSPPYTTILFKLHPHPHTNTPFFPHLPPQAQ